MDDEKTVGTGLPPNVTTAPETKFVPLTVTATVAPVCPDDGEMAVTTGTGLTTVSVAIFEGPPPGSGFAICTLALPLEVASGKMKFMVEASTKADGTAEPFTVIAVEGRKPKPWI